MKDCLSEMDRVDIIELALQGSKAAEFSEDATNVYVDLAEHLLACGHASSISEVDLILRGMSVESADAILEASGSDVISEGAKEIASGQEMDPEGYMVLRQMNTAKQAIMRIEAYIGGQKDLQLPAWVQAKLAVAAADLDSIGDYFISDTEPTMWSKRAAKQPPFLYK